MMSPPTTTELRNRLADTLVAGGLPAGGRIEAAFRSVPRHLLAPEVPPETAYCNRAIWTRASGSLSSSPRVMAVMLEQLQVHPGQRVLEVGTGTAYNAALLAHLVGAGGQVVSVEIDDRLVVTARRRLAEAGVRGVEVVTGDGTFGHQSGGPYDRIILTAATNDLAPRLVSQLEPDGVLVVPLLLRAGVQKSVAFRRVAGGLESISVQDAASMHQRGGGLPRSTWELGGGVQLLAESPAPAAAIAEMLLRGLPGEESTGTQVRNEEVFGGLDAWLATHDRRVCQLRAVGARTCSSAVPPLSGYRSAGRPPARRSSTLGLAGAGGLALLAPAPSPPPEDGPWELLVRRHGEDAHLARSLLQCVHSWVAADRPRSGQLRISAYPTRSGPPASSLPLIVRPWMTLASAWAR